MRSLKSLVLVCIPLLFSGCLEINEDVSVNNNGSGKYGMKIEMGELFEMLQSFMPAEEFQKGDFDKPKDTTLLLKSFVDTASSLPAETRALLRDGSLHMKINMAEKVFNIDMQYPFSSMASFQKLYTTLGQSSAGLGDMLKGLNPAAPADAPKDQPSLNKVASYFDLITEPHSISRKLNKERYAAMATDSAMEQMKNMSALGGGAIEMKMNMTLHLPAPVKKFTGPKASLSDTKKTVIIKNNMLDIFEHPENFEFSVEY